MSIDFREEGRGRVGERKEGGEGDRQKETSNGCLPYVPRPGTEPAAQVLP